MSSNRVRMWRQKDGTLIYIRTMNTNHIYNCINIINKKILKSMLTGEPIKPFKIILSGLVEEYNKRPKYDINEDKPDLSLFNN